MAPHRRRALILFVVGLVLVAAGKSLLGKSGPSGLGTIPLPASAGNLPEPIAGVECRPALHENAAYHIHATLSIRVDGQAVEVPSNVGIVTDPDTGQVVCMYELHTHDNSGEIHIEAPEPRTFTLGQFFAVAGVPLTPENVAGFTVGEGGELRVMVDGQPLEPVTAEALYNIELVDGRKIDIEIRSGN